MKSSNENSFEYAERERERERERGEKRKMLVSFGVKQMRRACGDGVFIEEVERGTCGEKKGELR